MRPMPQRPQQYQVMALDKLKLERLLIEAGDDIEAELVEAWKMTGHRDNEGRELIYLKMMLVKSVIDTIKVKAEMPILSEVTK